MSRLKTGFTLIEVLVVAAITGFITTFMLVNFSRTRINYLEESNILMSKLRIAQTKAISSTRFNNSIRCGYGVRYINTRSYAIYVGRTQVSQVAQVKTRTITRPEGTPIPTQTLKL